MLELQYGILFLDKICCLDRISKAVDNELQSGKDAKLLLSVSKIFVSYPLIYQSISRSSTGVSISFNMLPGI